MNTSGIIDRIALLLLVIGGINWGLIGLFNLNLVELLFGEGIVASIVYILVGISAIWSATLFFRERSE